MKKQLLPVGTLLLILSITLFNCPVYARSSGTQELTMEIMHTPVKEANARNRILLEVQIRDTGGVESARAYFKSAAVSEYSFVMLDSEDNETFTGILPAPAIGSGSFEYLILARNAENHVYKTQTYQVTVKDDENVPASTATDHPVKVYTELQHVPEELAGFSDDILLDVVESSAKLGVVAGLYNTSSAGVSTSGAVSAGTLAASTGGLPTTAIVAGSVAAAAAVGVAAASDDSSGGGDGPETASDCPWTGNWAGTAGGTDYDGTTSSENWQGTVNSSCLFTVISMPSSPGGQINRATGNVSFQVPADDAGCGPATLAGTFSGTAVSGTYEDDCGRGTWSGSRR